MWRITSSSVKQIKAAYAKIHLFKWYSLLFGAALAMVMPNVYATAFSDDMNNSGSSQPVSITQPYLGVSFIIALEGIFPSRN